MLAAFSLTLPLVGLGYSHTHRLSHISRLERRDGTPTSQLVDETPQPAHAGLHLLRRLQLAHALGDAAADVSPEL